MGSCYFGAKGEGTVSFEIESLGAFDIKKILIEIFVELEFSLFSNFYDFQILERKKLRPDRKKSNTDTKE